MPHARPCAIQEPDAGSALRAGGAVVYGGRYEAADVVVHAPRGRKENAVPGRNRRGPLQLAIPTPGLTVGQAAAGPRRISISGVRV